MSVSLTQVRSRLRHRRQQFVSERVAERVIDALEIVEVQIKDRELSAPRLTQLSCCSKLLAEQMPCSAGSVSGIVVRQMCDPFLCALALGNVVVSRNPPALGQRLVYDLNRAPIRCLDGHFGGAVLSQILQDRVPVAGNVSGK